MLNLNLIPRSRTLLIGVAATAAVLTAPATVAAEPVVSHEAAPQPDGVTPHPGVTLDNAVDSTLDDVTDELLDRCPVDGAATYEDSWGWSRSGGRSHEGVDMVADRGTPVVAVRDADAVFKHNRLGGNAVWLTTADGDKFYYAHLDAFEGESRTVQAGDVIGYVGSTGNARGAHLHFETLPDAQVENPYPHTVGACIPTPAEVAAIQVADSPMPTSPHGQVTITSTD